MNEDALIRALGDTEFRHEPCACGQVIHAINDEPGIIGAVMEHQLSTVHQLWWKWHEALWSGPDPTPGRSPGDLSRATSAMSVRSRTGASA